MSRSAIIKTAVPFLTLREKADLQSSSKGLVEKFAKDAGGNFLGFERLEVLTKTPVSQDGHQWVEIKTTKRQQGWIPSEHLAYEAQIRKAPAAPVYSNPFTKPPSRSSSPSSLPNRSKVFVLNFHGPADGYVEVIELKGSKLELIGWMDIDDLSVG